MQKRIGIVLALALTAAAIVTGTALAKPGSGTVITFDNGTLLKGGIYEEAGATVTPSVFGGLDIRDADKDGDDELVIGASRKLWATVGLGGLPFDLTSLDVEAFSFDPLDPRGGKSQGLIVTSPEGDYIQITSTGTVTLNWTAVTSVRISIDAGRRVGSPTGTIDNIILNGGGKGNNGKKAEKASVCHVSGDGSTNIINVNGNAVAAHLAHGDTLAIDHKGQLICKPVKPPGPQK